MPSERFFHLPEEKKRRIKKAALKEFARVPLEEISINRIIRDAEIPRGSFYQYFEDKQDLQTFLDNQLQLFPEPVAETLEEAEYFLEDCMAILCENKKEVKQYFEEEGVDLCGMSTEELLEQPEVFALSGGRYLIVEA